MLCSVIVGTRGEELEGQTSCDGREVSLPEELYRSFSACDVAFVLVFCSCLERDVSPGLDWGCVGEILRTAWNFSCICLLWDVRGLLEPPAPSLSVRAGLDGDAPGCSSWAGLWEVADGSSTQSSKTLSPCFVDAMVLGGVTFTDMLKRALEMEEMPFVSSPLPYLGICEFAGAKQEVGEQTLKRCCSSPTIY